MLLRRLIVGSFGKRSKESPGEPIRARQARRPTSGENGSFSPGSKPLFFWLLGRICGRRPARARSCFGLQKNRHRGPLSATAGQGHAPSGRRGGIRPRPADRRPEADIRPHRNSRRSPIQPAGMAGHQKITRVIAAASPDGYAPAGRPPLARAHALAAAMPPQLKRSKGINSKSQREHSTAQPPSFQ